MIDDDDLAEANRLQDYLFTSPDQPGDYLCVLGYGMMYNHSIPNAEWEIDDDDIQFVLHPLQPISTVKRFSSTAKNIGQHAQVTDPCGQTV